ncbi:MAG: class I SAM-dependent methyltransferase [Thermoplasmata archaeon]
MRSKGIKVPKIYAENILEELKEKGFLNKNLKLKHDNDYLIIPVEDSFNSNDYEISYHDFEELVERKSYKDYLNIDEEIKKRLPTSYDRIGDIVIIKLDDDLLGYAKNIAESIIRFHKNVRTVAIDYGVKGEYRIRNLKVILGNIEDTIYVENGVKMYVNPFMVYFSPRLANERKNIADMVYENEIVFDLFCGSGPFSLNIAKKKNSIIYSVDKNPYGIKLLKRSIVMNKFDNIIPIVGDVRVILNNLPYADRIIMDLPFNSTEFLKYVKDNVKIGTKIHLYLISDKNKFHVINENWVKIENVYEVHQYSPNMSMFRIDLEVVRF